MSRARSEADSNVVVHVCQITALHARHGLARFLLDGAGCDMAHVGATADVPYTARYFFYRTETHHPEHNVRCGG